jgi:hypothetical protein
MYFSCSVRIVSDARVHRGAASVLLSRLPRANFLLDCCKPVRLSRGQLSAPSRKTEDEFTLTHGQELVALGTPFAALTPWLPVGVGGCRRPKAAFRSVGEGVDI